MEKVFIDNRKGQYLAVLVELHPRQCGVALIMHGLGGYKEQDIIIATRDAFYENGFTTVRFDATNSIGESQGSYDQATIRGYFEDLEDVIAWAKTQPWFFEPFALAGHSVGGLCTTRFAEKNPEKVRVLIPVSPVVSGHLLLDVQEKQKPGILKMWKKRGWVERPFLPGISKLIPWKNAEQARSWEVLTEANRLEMPVLLIVGAEDDLTPPRCVEELFEAVPAPKEFHIISGATHKYDGLRDISRVKKIMQSWIKRYCLLP